MLPSLAIARGARGRSAGGGGMRSEYIPRCGMLAWEAGSPRDDECVSRFMASKLRGPRLEDGWELGKYTRGPLAIAVGFG